MFTVRRCSEGDVVFTTFIIVSASSFLISGGDVGEESFFFFFFDLFLFLPILVQILKNYGCIRQFEGWLIGKTKGKKGKKMLLRKKDFTVTFTNEKIVYTLI